MAASTRVLVTAGASGIGLAIARAFTAGGGDVFVCDIDAAALAALPTVAPGVRSCRCDMGDRAEIGPMVEAAASALGGIDVLVNNAGIGGPTAPVEAIDPDDWDRVLRVNITSMFDTSRAAIPWLRRSGNAERDQPVVGRGPLRLRESRSLCDVEVGCHRLHQEPGRGARPRRHPRQRDPARDRRRTAHRPVFEGRAALSGRTVDEEKRVAMVNQSIPRLVQAADIAAMAVFLASDGGKAISGQALAVDNDLQRL